MPGQPRFGDCLPGFVRGRVSGDRGEEVIPLQREQLGGDLGLGVLAGQPQPRPVDCANLAPVGPYQAAATPNWDTFGYQAYTDRYTYPWKTTRAYANACREFSFSFTDGTTRSAYLEFVL